MTTRIFFRTKRRLPCDASRAADHDDTSIACQISSQIYKKIKTVLKKSERDQEKKKDNLQEICKIWTESPERTLKVQGSARSKGLLVQIFQISCRFLKVFCKRSCRKIKREICKRSSRKINKRKSRK